MANISILTDSSCDVEAKVLEKWNVKEIQLDVIVDDGGPCANCDVIIQDFYQKLREGSMAKTSAANAENFRVVFEPELQAGNDIIYLGFSSGLSTTFNSSRIAAEELAEKYPDRKIKVIDTLCASLGQGLIVNLAVTKRDSGASFEEICKYVEDTLPNLCHWFTVDDLQFLKRGGRVSGAVALIGSMLSIKPVMHVDDCGKLIKVSQVRGRKTSIRALADKLISTAIDPTGSPVFISHGDCIDDAKELADILKKECGIKNVYINYVGPVIGAHSGPGTLALFFLGKER
ncbi:MAG: DegV family protein [Ruminococcaceae bacterium]|nr:DegV family protein [Oscillospiraceae bacterium]